MENLYRYFLHLGYNGSDFHGWQAQKNSHTIQEELEKALCILSGSSKIQLTGAGRTDTGVHAREYYAHFDLGVLLEHDNLHQLAYKLNHLLPDSIAIYDIFRVNSDIHARFSALYRTYRYYICRNYDPFAVGISYRYTIALDIDLMNQAASLILAHKDFTCFTKTGADTSNNICIVTVSRWYEQNNFLIYETTANRFLRNMVRAMVGTLLDVGRKKITISEFQQILEHGSRSDAGRSVPACGLFLEKIEYPEDLRLLQ